MRTPLVSDTVWGSMGVVWCVKCVGSNYQLGLLQTAGLQHASGIRTLVFGSVNAHVVVSGVQ